MKNFTRKLAGYVLPVLLLFMACKKQNQRQELKDFTQVNLVDNNGKYGATRSDPTLMNAWGLVFNPSGIAWVNAQAGHVSEVYDREGNSLRPPVGIPSPGGGATGGNPSGIAFNGTQDFKLSNGAAALFLFVSEDGIFSGWNGTAGANALLIKDNSATASYKGLTMASNGGANYLYAANFKSGKVDVWDKDFMPVSFSFTDPAIPSGYAPFNVQAVASWIVVTYAKVGSDGDEQKGEGLGFVSIFNTDGSFVRRFASHGPLNAPWGVTEAPASFFDDNDSQGDNKSMSKTAKNDDQPLLLVGNFGDGYINAYSLLGEFLGQLRSHGKPIWIDGLWALSFPPSTSTIDPDRLYFTAGPNDENDGLFGYLIKQ